MKWRTSGEFRPKPMYNFQIHGVTARVPLSSPVIRTSLSVTKYFLPFLSLSTLRSAGSTLFKVEALAATLAVRANRSMASSDGAPEADGAGVKKSSRELSHVQRLVAEDRSGGWEKCWELGKTAWDLGGPTPVVVHLSETGSLPKGRALVPGCGTGYDVVAMACPDRHVVGLDISKTAVERSTKIFSSLPNSKYFSFLNEDFFTWQPTEKFDLIFDYTFFCAFEPHVRPLWAKRMRELLKPGGELITLMFPIDDRTGGPPFSASVSDYKEILIPLGFETVSIVDNELAVGPRKGSEKLGRWKKSSVQSAM